MNYKNPDTVRELQHLHEIIQSDNYDPDESDEEESKCIPRIQVGGKKLFTDYLGFLNLWYLRFHCLRMIDSSLLSHKTKILSHNFGISLGGGNNNSQPIQPYMGELKESISWNNCSYPTQSGKNYN